MPNPEEESKIRQAASMRYWWPKLKRCSVPVPETTVIPIREWEEATQFTEGVPVPDCTEITPVIESHGPPAFIRTDQASNKHKMKTSSKVASSDYETVRDHVCYLIRFNKMAGFTGLPWRDIVVRDWLNLKHKFKAFEHTPVAAEIRLFIYNNTVKDYGFYWPEAALEQHFNHTPELPSEWKTKRDQLEQEALSDVDTVQSLAQTVAEEFSGYWSIDFAQTTNDGWYAIDMAPGIASQKPEGCTKPESLTDNGLKDVELPV